MKKIVGICLQVIGWLLFLLAILSFIGSYGEDKDVRNVSIIFLLISIGIVFAGLALYKRSKTDTKKEFQIADIVETNKSIYKEQKPFYKWLICIAIFLGATLPFHYIPTALMVFPKDNFSFNYTIITQEDIDQLINRYNNCRNIFEQQSISNEPLFRKLNERGLIYDRKGKPKHNFRGN